MKRTLALAVVLLGLIAPIPAGAGDAGSRVNHGAGSEPRRPASVDADSLPFR